MLIIDSYSIQFRYGSRWGPRHPGVASEIPATAPVEILFGPAEYMTHISGSSGYVIDGIQVNTDLRMYPWIGRNGNPSPKVGKKILYLKGATHDYDPRGIFVTRLTAVFDSCDVWETMCHIS